jgi:hypothetical protein
MAYMQAGDFEEAKLDFEAVGLNNTLSFFLAIHFLSLKFNLIIELMHVCWFSIFQMIKFDKSAEPDATAALAKLKLKEQVRLIT